MPLAPSLPASNILACGHIEPNFVEKMKPSILNPSEQSDPDRLADFVIHTQGNCILSLAAELIKGNVSFQQCFLLTYLSSHDYLTMSDIARKLGHTTPAATALVDRLESLDYVDRIHSAGDRRKIMVRITAKGVELVGRMRNEIANNLAVVLAGRAKHDADSVERSAQSSGLRTAV